MGKPTGPTLRTAKSYNSSHFKLQLNLLAFDHVSCLLPNALDSMTWIYPVANMSTSPASACCSARCGVSLPRTVDLANTLLVRPPPSNNIATTNFEAVSCDLQQYESKVEFWRVLVESGGVGVE